MLRFFNAYISGFITMLIASVSNFLLLRLVVAAPHAATRQDADYHPYPTDWRSSPHWVVFTKDVLRDLFLACRPDKVIDLPVVRRIWVLLAGNRIERSVNRAGLLFVHIPKNGGTSISKTLYGYSLPHLTASTLEHRFDGRLAAYPSFAVLRHPVDRFLSAYRFTLAGGTDLMLTSRFERWRLGVMEPIEAFLDTIETRPALFRGMQQFHRQIDYVAGRRGDILTTHLFAMSRDGELPPRLYALLGVEDVPHINRSPSMEITLSAATERRILDLYRADMELYEQVLRTEGGSVVRLWNEQGSHRIVEECAVRQAAK